MQSKTHTLSWDNISYSVQLSKPGLCCTEKFDKKILDDVSGSIQSGKTCAIMGPSGSSIVNRITYISSNLCIILFLIITR